MNGISDWLSAFNSTLIGVGTLLTGVGAVLKLRRSSASAADSQVQSPRKRFSTAALLGGATLLTLGVVLVAFRPARGQEPTITAAWRAFNNREYSQAIAAADQCVDALRGEADRMQAQLQGSNAADPPVGSVTSAVRSTILARGPLNDVATCLWIKGRAAEATGQVAVARQAYEAAARYTYARTWDSRGWFWAPAVDARDRHARLR